MIGSRKNSGAHDVVRDLDAEILGVGSTVTATGGVRFAVVTGSEADDPISQSLAAGVYPADYLPLFHLLTELVPPGGRVLDLGAHVGTFSLAAAAAGYQVTSVEASPRNVALLKASVARNDWDRLKVVHAGVSDSPGVLEFCPHGPYGHVLTPATNFPSVKVAAVRVDDLLADVGWDRADFIKMDIEGSEVAGVRGMAELLSRADAPPIVYEANGHTLSFYEQTPQSLKSALEGFGFRNYLMEPGRLVGVRAGDLQPATCVDYLALKQAPANLDGWRIEESMSPKKVINRLLASCASANVAERLYAVRAIAGAPEAIQSHRRVRAAVNSLRSDTAEEVRAAATAVAGVPEPFRVAVWKRWAGRSGTRAG